jgi:hypothetical protein
VVLDAGTVDTVSVVGEVVGHFRCMAAEGVAGVPDVNTTHISDTAQTANDVGQDVNDILTDTADMQPKLGTVSNLGGGATLAANNSDMAGATFSSTTDSQEALRDNLATAAALTTVDTEVGNIQGDLDDGTNGLAAIKNAINTVDTVVDDIQQGRSYDGPRGPGVYFDDASGASGTTLGTNGTVDAAVNLIGDAKTLADAMGTRRIYVVNDSTATLTAVNWSDYEFVGIGHADTNVVALESRQVDNCSFYNLKITGVQGGTLRAMYVDCVFGTVTVYCHAIRCGLTDSVSTGVTFSSNDDNVLEGCYSMVPGNAAPVIDASGANLDLSIRHYSGGISFSAIAAGATATIEGVGNVTFQNVAGVNANASVTIRGWMSINDLKTMTNLTYIATQEYMLHTSGTSGYDPSTDSLQAIRDRGDTSWTTGAGGNPPQLMQNTTIATLSTQTSFTLTAGSADDDAYNGCIVVVTDQATSTQKAHGTVSDYTGSTKTITLAADPLAGFVMAAGDTIDIIAPLGSAGSAPTAAAIATEVWDRDATGHQTTGTFGQAIGDPGANTETIYDAVVTDATGINVATDVANVLVDTNELQGDWTNAGRLDAILDTIAADVVNVDGIVPAAAGDSMALTTAAVDAIWDETMTAHVTADSAAVALKDTLADTNELQGDWTDAGRLDAILDTIAGDVVNIDGIVPAAAGDSMALTAAAVDSIWDETKTSHVTADSFAVAIKDIDTNADTTISSRMPTTHIDATGGAVDNVTLVATTTTNTDMVGTDGALLASSVNVAAGIVEANVKQVDDDATAAQNLEASLDTLVTGAVSGGTSDTDTVVTNITGHGNDTFIGRVLIFRTGTLQYEAGTITDYVSATGTFEFAANTWTTGAADTDAVVIV